MEFEWSWFAVTFSWSPVLFDAEKSCEQFAHLYRTYDEQRPLLPQQLRNFTDPLQSKEGQDEYSKWMTALTHPDEQDFSEDVLEFEDYDSSTLYMLHFEAFKQKLSMTKNGLTIRTFKENTDVLEASASSCTKNL